jgi:hypothetical protein
MLQNRPPATMPDERRQPTEERIQDSIARVAIIERSILVLLVVGLLIGVLAVVKPFTTAILFGAALATAAWPVRQALVRRGLGHGSAAALFLLLSIHPILRTGGSNLSSSAGESGAAMAYPGKHLAGGSAPGEALSRLPLLG